MAPMGKDPDRKHMTSQKRAPAKPGNVDSYPVLPLRDIVVFPHMIVPLFVGREKSIRALEEVMKGDKFILLATQQNAGDDDPATDSIFKTGTLATVLQLLKTLQSPYSRMRGWATVRGTTTEMANCLPSTPPPLTGT